MMEFGFGKGFCEDISYVISCRYVCDRYLRILNSFTDEVVANIDMFDACIELVVFG